MKIVLSRPVRRRFEGNGNVKPGTEYVDVEFNLPKEYDKILNPVFSDLYYDYDLREENGVISFVLTSRPQIHPNKETQNIKQFRNSTTSKPVNRPKKRKRNGQGKEGRFNLCFQI